MVSAIHDGLPNWVRLGGEGLLADLNVTGDNCSIGIVPNIGVSSEGFWKATLHYSH